MAAELRPVGPPALGFELGADVAAVDGWLVRELVAAPGLDGPPGILQGGFAAGIAIEVARAADPHGAPLTSLEARLHAPTPLGRPLRAAVRALDVARYRVEVRDGDILLVSAEVELAGHDPTPHALDLLDLARVELPEPRPQHDYPTCWSCGAEPIHPHAQRMHPRWYRPQVQVVPWVAEEVLADERGRIDPLVISAVLDCPSAWVAMEHARASGAAGVVLGGWQLRPFKDAPALEVLRVVARMDEAEGRKVRSRAALIDEDGVVYALASALQIAVPEVPSLQRPEAG